LSLINDAPSMFRIFSVRIGLVAVVACALAMRPSAARAEDPEELIKEGVKLRRQGEDARAEGYLRRAYQLAETPRTAAQLGLVELALKEFLEAETHLGIALESQDSWVTEHKQTLETSRVAARKHLVRVEAAPLPSETTYSAGGAAPKPVPGDSVLWLAAGKATTLRFEAPGHKAAVMQVEGTDGETRHLTVDMPALVAATPPRASEAEATPPAVAPSSEPAAAAQPTGDQPADEPAPAATAPAPGARLRYAGIGVGAFGVVAGAVGAVLLVQGNSKVSHIESSKTYDAADGNFATLQNAGVGLLIGGGVALAGGVALYLVGRHAASETAPASTVSFAPSPGGGGVAWRGAF
jgi:hypothetical protein